MKESYTHLRGACWDCIWKNKKNRKEIFAKFHWSSKLLTALCILGVLVGTAATGGALAVLIASCVGFLMSPEIITDILHLCPMCF